MARRGKLNKQKTKDETIRPVRVRRYDHFFLIVCEDEKTEPYYFGTFVQKFPDETVFLKTIGTGKKPKGIVEQSILEREKFAVEAKKSINEVWVVFDKDDEGNNDKTLANFNEAWAIAAEQNIHIAFSNEVFELWLLLHFREVSSVKAIPRAEIYSNLATAIQSFRSHESFAYNHGKTEVIDVLLALGNEKKATERAEKLLLEQKGKRPIEANPSTTVHLLVKRLRDLIEWYSYSPE
jgi:hypothetical protein